MVRALATGADGPRVKTACVQDLSRILSSLYLLSTAGEGEGSEEYNRNGNPS